MGMFQAMLVLLPAMLIPQIHLAVENRALRQQLAVCKQSVKRPKLHPRDRAFWVWLSRLWPNWRSVLAIVQPETVIRWHRQGCKLYWRWKSRAGQVGRPRIDPEIRELIRRMSRENPTWGAPRILSELLLLGYDVAEGTVTTNPYAEWTARQIINAFPYEEAPRFLLRDRDGIYGDHFKKRIKNMGIEEVLIAPRSPWQNPYCERVIGSIRRECLDHVLVLGEAHLKRILTAYFQYYHESRCHLALDRNSPRPRQVEAPDRGAVISIPQVGGLHHRYTRCAA